jgi:hypothetical protein
VVLDVLDEDDEEGTDEPPQLSDSEDEGDPMEQWRRERSRVNCEEGDVDDTEGDMEALEQGKELLIMRTIAEHFPDLREIIAEDVEKLYARCRTTAATGPTSTASSSTSTTTALSTSTSPATQTTSSTSRISPTSTSRTIPTVTCPTMSTMAPIATPCSCCPKKRKGPKKMQALERRAYEAAIDERAAAYIEGNSNKAAATFIRDAHVGMVLNFLEVDGEELLSAEGEQPEFLSLGVCLDSCVGDHVLAEVDVPGYTVEPSLGSLANHHFVAAGGKRIRMEGQVNAQFAIGSGGAFTSCFQVVAVTRLLWSVGRICDNVYRPSSATRKRRSWTRRASRYAYFSVLEAYT